MQRSHTTYRVTIGDYYLFKYGAKDKSAMKLPFIEAHSCDRELKHND